MPPSRRARAILLFIGAAQAALSLFALIPAPWNFLCLFVNGLPLGMVFGLVLGFLEGRHATEALAAGLCASFILTDGMTILDLRDCQPWIGEGQMPFFGYLSRFRKRGFAKVQ